MEFQLRPWEITDLHTLVKHADNWNVAGNLTDKFPHPYTHADGEAFIEFTSTQIPIRVFAIVIEGEAVGAIGVQPQSDIHRKNAELGYWLAEPYWGKGIISSAIKEMLDFAFNTFDIDRIFARPFGTNIASQKVLEKNGFILEAKLKKVLYKHETYLDELIYAVRKTDWQNKA